MDYSALKTTDPKRRAFSASELYPSRLRQNNERWGEIASPHRSEFQNKDLNRCFDEKISFISSHGSTFGVIGFQSIRSAPEIEEMLPSILGTDKPLGIRNKPAPWENGSDWKISCVRKTLAQPSKRPDNLSESPARRLHACRPNFPFLRLPPKRRARHFWPLDSPVLFA